MCDSLTNKQASDLTHRLVDTVIEFKEKYEKALAFISMVGDEICDDDDGWGFDRRARELLEELESE